MLDRFDQGGHDLGPGLGRVVPVITAAAYGQDPALTDTVGDPAQGSGYRSMHRRTHLQMGNGIAGEGVRPALQQNELGRVILQEAFGRGPQAHELPVLGERGQGYVQFGAAGRAGPGLMGMAGARIQVVPILVEVDDGEVRVIGEGVEHPVAVVGVYIHVGDAPDAMHLPQGLDGNAAVVEDTEAGRPVAPCMVEPGDGHHGPGQLPSHDPRHRIQRTPDDEQRRFVDTHHGRRIAIIQITLPRHGLPTYLFEVGADVKPQHVLVPRPDRRQGPYPRLQPRLLEGVPEGIVAIRAEGVAVAETIAGELLAAVNTDSLLDCHGVGASPIENLWPAHLTRNGTVPTWNTGGCPGQAHIKVPFAN